MLKEALLKQGVDVGEGSREFLLWLVDHGAPSRVVEHFARCSIRAITDHEPMIDWVALYDETGIMRSMDCDRLLASGLLQVGYCPNGDFVVVDLREQVGSVGYVSHDYVWEDQSADPRDYCIVVADSLDDLAELGSSEGNLPIDYFAARESG